MRIGIGLGITAQQAAGGGGTPAFDPASLFGVSDLGGVYAPSPSTCFTDTDGTTPAAVGDTVARINDLSGKAAHPVQATPGARPTLRQSAGGFYYLEFDGVDDFLSAPSAITVGADFYFGAAATIASGGTFLRSLFSTTTGPGGASTGANTMGIYQRGDVGRILASLRVGTGTAFTANIDGSFSIGTPFVGEAYHESSTLYASNVSASATTAAAEATTTTGQPISIGGTASMQHFYGGVCIDRALTAPEKTAVRSWLANLAGITL
jgi:hypothetical protein